MNPNIINYLIIGLYLVNTFWWVYQGNYWQAMYWVGATVLTIGIVGGMK